MGNCTVTTAVSNSEVMNRRLSEHVAMNMTLEELAQNVPNFTREQAVAFLESQHLWTVAELAAITTSDLSAAFPDVSTEFTLGHRAAVRTMATTAQQVTSETSFSHTPDDGFSSGSDVERMLGGKECF